MHSNFHLVKDIYTVIVCFSLNKALRFKFIFNNMLLYGHLIAFLFVLCSFEMKDSGSVYAQCPKVL